MDIKPSITLPTLPTFNKPVDNLLALSLGQKIDVKVLGDVIKTEANAIGLKMADRLLTVQSNQPVKLAPGQALQILVTKVIPTLEFAILGSTANVKLPALPKDLRLTLIPAPAEKPETADLLPVKQPLPAKIIGLTDNKIQLQVSLTAGAAQKTAPSAEQVANKPTLVITIERAQVQTPKITADRQVTFTSSPQTSPAPNFKVGDAVILEISPQRKSVSYQLTPAATPGVEEKVAGFIKQFLPRHEPAPVLLNQLIKELPQLTRHSGVSETLKRIAAEILQNLPQRQQLNENSLLKKSVVNSGVFLEARMPELAKNPELTLPHDFKANLLKLIEAIKQEVAKPENLEAQDIDLTGLKNLQQKSENNVARIIIDQLSSLPKEEGAKQIWTIDIPFVDRGQAENVSIQIALDKESEQQGQRDKWSVTMTLTPPGLGTIQCHLSYQNGVINTLFRSQQVQTTQLISQHLEHLKLQMESAGLKTGLMNIQEGLQAEKSAYAMTGNSLLDEKA